MGSSASRTKSVKGRNDQSCGCLTVRSKQWSADDDGEEEEDCRQTQNKNQNRNQSQNIAHQPELHNNNGHEDLGASDFKVLKLKAAIDKRLTSIDEKSNAVLKYRTPHFRALATVEIPALEDKQSIQIGWIQTCVHMNFVNQYGTEGITSWEFPEIVLTKYKMISDADGKMYPWYGSKHEVHTVTGPNTSRQHVTVHMNDNFFPQVTWYVPNPDFDRQPRLTHIHRKQKFYTFLVAKNLQTQDVHILRTIIWGMELNIDVNPELPLGKRAKLTGPMEQETPLVLETNPIELPSYAMNPPNANNSQTLIWRPSKGESRVIVPPAESTVSITKYLQNTRHYHNYLREQHAMCSPES